MPRRTSARSPKRTTDPTDAQLQVLSVIRRIPRGRVLTYGGVAAAAGLPGRARWVGTILRTCPLAAQVPWHRVVNSTGRISERAGEGPDRQRHRLEAEGIVFGLTGRIDFSVHLWKPSKPRQPARRTNAKRPRSARRLRTVTD